MDTISKDTDSSTRTGTPNPSQSQGMDGRKEGRKADPAQEWKHQRTDEHSMDPTHPFKSLAIDLHFTQAMADLYENNRRVCNSVYTPPPEGTGSSANSNMRAVVGPRGLRNIILSRRQPLRFHGFLPFPS